MLFFFFAFSSQLSMLSHTLTPSFHRLPPTPFHATTPIIAAFIFSLPASSPIFRFAFLRFHWLSPYASIAVLFHFFAIFFSHFAAAFFFALPPRISSFAAAAIFMYFRYFSDFPSSSPLPPFSPFFIFMTLSSLPPSSFAFISLIFFSRFSLSFEAVADMPAFSFFAIFVISSSFAATIFLLISFCHFDFIIRFHTPLISISVIFLFFHIIFRLICHIELLFAIFTLFYVFAAAVFLLLPPFLRRLFSLSFLIRRFHF